MLQITKRLLVLIQTLLKENPIFPVQFIFRQECLLQKLSDELTNSTCVNNNTSEQTLPSEPFHSPRFKNLQRRQQESMAIAANMTAGGRFRDGARGEELLN